MAERTGSLFPSVGTSSTSGVRPTTSTTTSTATSTTTSTATSWLQNSSFPEHLVQQLNSVSSSHSRGVETATSAKTTSLSERKGYSMLIIFLL